MTRKVCLHQLIQNSLAQYLNFKWSKNKLYLKKRKKISKNYDCNAVEKRSQPDKRHSILNLQNDVFVFNSKTKTFNQLDLCECFQEDELEYKNGLCVNTKISKDLISRKTLENKNDVIGDVKRKVRYSDQSEALKQEKNNRFVGKLIPSKQPEPSTYQDKFSYFIQNEFNKCSGKNLTVRTFTASSREESNFDGKNNVRSSSLGFYTITTFDQTLKARNKHKTKLQETACETKAFGGILTVAKSPYEQRFSSMRKECEGRLVDTGVQYNPTFYHSALKLHKEKFESDKGTHFADSDLRVSKKHHRLSTSAKSKKSEAPHKTKHKDRETRSKHKEKKLEQVDSFESKLTSLLASSDNSRKPLKAFYEPSLTSISDPKVLFTRTPKKKSYHARHAAKKQVPEISFSQTLFKQNRSVSMINIPASTTDRCISNPSIFDDYKNDHKNQVKLQYSPEKFQVIYPPQLFQNVHEPQNPYPPQNYQYPQNYQHPQNYQDPQNCQYPQVPQSPEPRSLPPQLQYTQQAPNALLQPVRPLQPYAHEPQSNVPGYVSNYPPQNQEYQPGTADQRPIDPLVDTPISTAHFQATDMQNPTNSKKKGVHEVTENKGDQTITPNPEQPGYIFDILCKIKERVKVQCDEHNKTMELIIEELGRQKKELCLMKKIIVEQGCPGPQQSLECWVANTNHRFNPGFSHQLDGRGAGDGQVFLNNNGLSEHETDLKKSLRKKLSDKKTALLEFLTSSKMKTKCSKDTDNEARKSSSSSIQIFKINNPEGSKSLQSICKICKSKKFKNRREKWYSFLRSKKAKEFIAAK